MVQLSIAFSSSIPDTTEGPSLPCIASSVTSILWSKDGSSCVLGLENGQVMLLEQALGGSKMALAWRGIGHSRPITSLLYLNSPAHSQWEYQRSRGAIVSGDASGSITLWDVADGRALLSHPEALDHRITCMATDPSERFIFVSGWSVHLVILNASNLQVLHSMNLFDDWIFSILVQPSFMCLFTQHSGLYICQYKFGEEDSSDALPILHSFFHVQDENLCNMSEILIESIDRDMALLRSVRSSPSFCILHMHPRGVQRYIRFPIDIKETRGILISGSFRCILYNDHELSVWDISAELTRVYQASWPVISGSSLLTVFFSDEALQVLERLPIADNIHAIHSRRFPIGSPVPDLDWKAPGSTMSRLLSIHFPISAINFAYPDYLILGTTGGEIVSLLFHKLIKFESDSRITEGMRHFPIVSQTPITKISLFPHPISSAVMAMLLVCGTASGSLIVYDFSQSTLLSVIAVSTCPIKDTIPLPFQDSAPLTTWFCSIGQDTGIGIVSVVTQPEASDRSSLPALSMSFDDQDKFDPELYAQDRRSPLVQVSLVALWDPSPGLRPIALHKRKGDTPEDSNFLFLEQNDGSLRVFFRFTSCIKTIEGPAAQVIKSSCSWTARLDPTSDLSGDKRRQGATNPASDYDSSTMSGFPDLVVHLDMKRYLTDSRHPNLSKSLFLAFLALLDQPSNATADRNIAMQSLGYSQQNTFVRVAVSGANHLLTVQGGITMSPYMAAHRLLLVHAIVSELYDRYTERQGHSSSILEVLQAYLKYLSSPTPTFGFAPSLHYLGIKWADSSLRISSSAKELFSLVYLHGLKPDNRLSFVKYWSCLLTKPSGTDSVSHVHYASILLGITCIMEKKFIIDNQSLLDRLFESLLTISQESVKSRMSFTAAEILALGCPVWGSQWNDTVHRLVSLFVQMYGSSRNPQVQDLCRNSILRILLVHGPEVFSSWINDSFASFKSGASLNAVNKVQSVISVLSFIFSKIPGVSSHFVSGIVNHMMHDLDPHRPVHLEEGSQIKKGSVTIRDQMLPHVTHLLQTLMGVYGFIGYHQGTQRLAIAHDKGPILVYDLRTGANSHALEGLKHRADYIAFSGDGHMLAAFSDIDCVVGVWKVTVTTSGIAMFLSGGGTKPLRLFHHVGKHQSTREGRDLSAEWTKARDQLLDIDNPWRSKVEKSTERTDQLRIDWKADGTGIELSDGAVFVVQEQGVKGASHHV